MVAEIYKKNNESSSSIKTIISTKVDALNINPIITGTKQKRITENESKEAIVQQELLMKHNIETKRKDKLKKVINVELDKKNERNIDIKNYLKARENEPIIELIIQKDKNDVFTIVNISKEGKCLLNYEDL
jgi:hypothetical protein